MDNGEKLDKILGSVVRTETKVENIEAWQKKQEQNCRKDMSDVWKTISGKGGHGERISSIEAKRNGSPAAIPRKYYLMAGGGGSTLTAIIWLLVELVKK